MTASTSLHSNALNFMGFIENGVDPRTGQYTVSVKLNELAANDLRGPNMPLTLSYNPLNSTDSGFGLGWDLSLSQFDTDSNVLTLNSGERLKVTGTGEHGRLLMQEQKIDSFHFYRMGNGEYRLAHKDGHQEILREHSAGGARVALPVRFFAQSGHSVRLAYTTYAGYPLLRTVTDDSGQELLRIQRDVSQVRITLNPDTQLPSTYVLDLQDSDNKVYRLVLPTEEQAAWRFEYRPINEQMRITAVHTPTGAYEQIFYENGGHTYPVPGNPARQSRLTRPLQQPANNRLPLPRVARHLVRPGFDQPDIDVRYAYGPQDHNFLGGGLPLAWRDDGLDNLFRYTSDYEYWTRESLYVDDREQRRVQRTFNRFHLLTEELTEQTEEGSGPGKARVRVTTTYPYIDGLPFEEQPPYCQIPVQVLTRWSLDNDSRTRSETIKSRFDDHGNLISQTQANGIVEVREWYKADGSEEGCPADPEGFVRCLKAKTVMPSTRHASAQVLRTEYRYMRLPALADSGLLEALVPHTETVVEQGSSEVLQRTVFDYHDTPSDAFLHGRVGRQTQTVNGLDSLTEFTWNIRYDHGIRVVQTHETLSTRFDASRRTISSQQSTENGQTVQTLVDGVETRYSHDALNRLTEEIIAPDTEVKAARRYRYRLCGKDGDQAEQTVINAQDVTTLTRLDGLGRTVYEERDHVSEDQPWQMFALYEARFNAQDQMTRQTRHDWLAGENRALTSRFEYDNWGRQRCRTGPDGVQHHQLTDLIGPHTAPQVVIHNWIQGSSADAPQSDYIEVWLNLFGKPDREVYLDADNQPVGEKSWIYDGMGRCIESRNEVQQVTTFAYDAWSRLVRNELPDGTVVERSYAAHSTAELANALQVTDIQGNSLEAGRQQFDGLNRLTSLTVGQRTEHYGYREGQLQMSQRVTGARDIIDYEYDLRLTEEPRSINLTGSQARYEFDKVSARPTQAHNDQGRHEYSYDVNNQLRSSRWVDAANQSWETRYTASLLGLPLTTTLPDGMRTHHSYDDEGRVKTLEQGNLLATLNYDALGRPAHITTRHPEANSRLDTDIEYDDQSREVRRTLKLDQQPEQVLEQSWYPDGLLQRRRWHEAGLDLLDEHFEYDQRGRLSNHRCSGSHLPQDALGRSLREQVFVYDALDNVKTMRSFFDDETTERATYVYDPDSPCQLTHINYSPQRAQGTPVFQYDDNGNQLNDQHGRQLNYDTLGRLANVTEADGQAGGAYRYDGHDQLVACQQAGGNRAVCLYDGQRLSALIEDGQQTCLLYGPEEYPAPLGQQHSNDPDSALLLLCDANGSVRGDSCKGDLHQAVYDAYGRRHSQAPARSLPGFNGEWQDPSGWYLLGNGYRAYNPELMRFHSPDSLSPFGEGGLNPYMYCLGNPIALQDPTGHSGWMGQLRPNWDDETMSRSGGGGGVMAWVFVAIGVVATIASVYAAVASFGALTPVAVASGSGTAGAVAGATAATAGVAAGVTKSAVVSFVAATATAALTAGSTIAGAVNAATGDEAAGQWGQYLGIAAFATGMVWGAPKALPKILSRLKGLVKTVRGTGAAASTKSALGATASFADDLAGDTGALAGIVRGGQSTKAVAPMANVSTKSVAAIPRAAITPPAPPAPSKLGLNFRFRNRYPLANHLRFEGVSTASPHHLSSIRI